MIPQALGWLGHEDPPEASHRKHTIRTDEISLGHEAGQKKFQEQISVVKAHAWAASAPLLRHGATERAITHARFRAWAKMNERFRAVIAHSAPHHRPTVRHLSLLGVLAYGCPWATDCAPLSGAILLLVDVDRAS